MIPTLSASKSEEEMKEQVGVEMNWNYQIEGTESFMKTLVSSISFLSSDWMLLYEFWRSEGHRAPD